VGIHGYSMSIRKKFVGIRSVLLQNWEGIRVLGMVKVLRVFFRFSQNGRILFRILSNILRDTLEYFGMEYFGILWNIYFAEHLWKNGIPKGIYYLGLALNNFRIPFKNHEIPMEYLRIPGYSRYPTKTIEYLAKIIVEYHWILLNTFTTFGNKTKTMNTHEYSWITNLISLCPKFNKFGVPNPAREHVIRL